jgi:KipI family sensor histidine kinase inhibitor
VEGRAPGGYRHAQFDDRGRHPESVLKQLRPTAVIPLGDVAAYVEFSRVLDLEVNAFAQRLAAAVHARGEPWIRDVVPTLGGVALHFDPDFEGAVTDVAAELIERCLKEGLPLAEELGREVEVPVCYDKALGADLEEVAQKTGLAAEDVAARHCAGQYRVLMIGFAPGHAYMSGLDAKLALPRRPSPRAQVDAGSVAIANEQTVIYPYTIAGGWNIIGRTPLAVFDAKRERPSLFTAGDRVRFRAISRAEFDSFGK